MPLLEMRGQTNKTNQSYTSKGIGREGKGSFCKQLPCFNAMPCRPMPLLVRFRFNAHKRIVYSYFKVDENTVDSHFNVDRQES